MSDELNTYIVRYYVRPFGVMHPSGLDGEWRTLVIRARDETEARTSAVQFVGGLGRTSAPLGELGVRQLTRAEGFDEVYHD